MYIDQATYTQITGDSITDDKLKMASYLLDARIGVYSGFDGGLKLDINRLSEKSTFAVEHWVANMASLLKETDGSVQAGAESISLGRFSVDEGGVQGNDGLVPDSMRYYDLLIVDAGLVNRKLRIQRNEYINL